MLESARDVPESQVCSRKPEKKGREGRRENRREGGEMGEKKEDRIPSSLT